MHAAAALTLMLVTLAAARADDNNICPCGFTVNATMAEDGWALFTEIFESDFLHVGDLEADDDDTWIPQAYNVTPEASRGPHGKASQVENVVMNPNGRPYDWNSPGLGGPDPGLQLWVRHDTVPIPDTDNQSSVPMAEIVSARDDILYGSFRIGMRTTQVSGTCGAFFFYRNDSNEIDMEFLSSHQRNSERGFVNLVIQSPESAEIGYVQPGSNDFDNHSMAFDPSQMYHEYRFDWLPDRVDFYADSQWMSTIRTNVPNSPGAIHVSHWSNGNPGWSGGPPEQDAVLTISYIKAYFNSSNSDTTSKSLKMCKQGEMPSSTCQIPNELKPPDPSGPEGNMTGHTHFFTQSHSDEPSNPVSTPKPSGASGRSHLVIGIAGLFAWVLAIALMEEFDGYVYRALYSIIAGA